MTTDVDALISDHMKLAQDIAKREWRTAPHILHEDELLADAYLGLVDAANRWEAYCKKKNYKSSDVQYFKVFAGLRIRGTIRDHIRKDDWATRTLRTKSKKLREAGQDEGLSIEELAVRTDMTVSEINKVNAKLAQKPVSLDAHLVNIGTNFEQSGPNEESLKDSVNTEGAAFAKSMLDLFVKTLRKLPPTELLILVLHYYSKLDFTAISEELGLSEIAVLQAHTNGVLFVKQALLRKAEERD